jgi:hypothetical protein
MIKISSYRNKKNDSFSNKFEERLISFLRIDMKEKRHFESCMIKIRKMILFQTNLKKDWFLFFILIWKKNNIPNHVWLLIIYIIIYITSEWTYRFFSLIHRFLKWELIAFFFWLIAFWNETSSFFEMRHRCFFLLIHLDHHITFYNIYNHWWVSFLHAFDDMQRNFSSVWKNPKTIFWSRKSKTW